jgi:hypothetical protein
LNLAEVKLEDIDHLVIRSRKVYTVEFQGVPLTRDAATGVAPKVVARPADSKTTEKGPGAMHLTLEPRMLKFVAGEADAVRAPAIDLLSDAEIRNWTHPARMEFVTVGTVRYVHFVNDVPALSEAEKNRRMPAEVIGMEQP